MDSKAVVDLNNGKADERSLETKNLSLPLTASFGELQEVRHD